MTKICLSCNNTNNIYKIHKKSIKDSSDWMKLKRDVKYFKTNNIANISLTKKGNRGEFSIQLSKKFANRYVYYYAADSKNAHELSFSNPDKAYNKFKNSGVGKVGKDGVLKAYIKCPQNYMENGLWYPHIHFIVSNNNNKKWEPYIYTQIVLCHITKQFVKHAIKSNNFLILNALPMNEYIKDFIPMSMPLPYNSINDVDDVDITNYIKKLSVHSSNIHKYVLKNKDNIYNIPLIVYCYDSNCNASNILIRRLWNIGFKNIKEYSGGIKEWKK